MDKFKMTRFLQITFAVCMIAVAASVSFACWRLSVALDEWGAGGMATFAELTATARSLDGSAGALTKTLSQATSTLGEAQSTIHAVQPVVAKLGVTADRLNAGCDPAPCGTLANVNKTLATVRGTFGQIEVAARHENRNLTTLDTQEATLFADLHSTAGSANSTVADLDTLIKSPAIAGTLGNVQSMTGSGASILKDGADESHKLVHPDKVKLGFWAGTWAAMVKIHELLPPIF